MEFHWLVLHLSCCQFVMNVLCQKEKRSWICDLRFSCWSLWWIFFWQCTSSILITYLQDIDTCLSKYVVSDPWRQQSLNSWMFDWLIAIGFETSWSWCTLALNDGPFVPHIKLWEPCNFAKVPDGPHTYTLDVPWLQEKGAQICMSEWSQSFTLTKNVGGGFILCFTPPTQWTVWQP